MNLNSKRDRGSQKFSDDYSSRFLFHIGMTQQYESSSELSEVNVVQFNGNESLFSTVWSVETGGYVEPAAISADGQSIVSTDNYNVALFERDCTPGGATEKLLLLLG